MVFTQDHVHLRCNDWEAALRFFAVNLGAKEEERIVTPERVTITIRMGGIVYKVSPKKAGGPTPHREIYHLGFGTDDLFGEVSRMKARGVKITQEPVQNAEHPFAFVEGPEGIEIELIQRAK